MHAIMHKKNPTTLLTAFISSHSHSSNFSAMAKSFNSQRTEPCKEEQVLKKKNQKQQPNKKTQKLLSSIHSAMQRWETKSTKRLLWLNFVLQINYAALEKWKGAASPLTSRVKNLSIFLYHHGILFRQSKLLKTCHFQMDTRSSVPVRISHSQYIRKYTWKEK